MFTQDVQIAVMPIGGRTEKHRNFAINIVGSAEDQEKAQQLIREIGQYDRHDVVGMVCDAIDEIARRLAWEGCAVYELIHGEDGSQHILGFTSKRLSKLPGFFLQAIPRGDWDLWKRKVVVIPATRVWYLEMPAALCGRKGYVNILKRLRRFEHLGPEFWRTDLEHGSQSTGFDFQRYVRNSEIYYGQVTKRWGWNRRDWSQERCTEFFTFYKMIRFHKAQAMLREHIVAELNGLFARLGIRCDLQITGLPTPEDILLTERELSEGRITFGAASDRVRL
ncbi:MAG TPA: hypothetical protein VJS89_00780 [Gammaproteobacteria bacterium]|nr:hypothetical protein [Gammaproteobacteria bacterium]